MEKRFKWDRPFPDTEYDFVAHDGGKLVGRIYMHQHGPSEKRWSWFMQAPGHRRDPGCNGTEDTRQQAIDELTACYERTKP